MTVEVLDTEYYERAAVKYEKYLEGAARSFKKRIDKSQVLKSSELSEFAKFDPKGKIIVVGY